MRIILAIIALLSGASTVRAEAIRYQFIAQELTYFQQVLGEIEFSALGPTSGMHPATGLGNVTSFRLEFSPGSSFELGVNLASLTFNFDAGDDFLVGSFHALGVFGTEVSIGSSTGSSWVMGWGSDGNSTCVGSEFGQGACRAVGQWVRMGVPEPNMALWALGAGIACAVSSIRRRRLVQS